MPLVYHFNKKQTTAFFNKNKGYYLTDIKSYLTTDSIKRHTDVLPNAVYVREDTSGVAHRMLVWKDGVIKPEGSWVFGDIIFQYGDKTYARLPEDKKLTDEQADAIELRTEEYMVNDAHADELERHAAYDRWTNYRE